MAKKIILFEDEEIMINLLQKKLINEGYDVTVARDGKEGLEKLKDLNPDLILMDIIMPRMGGFEAMENIKNNEDWNKIPIIVISNSGQPVEIDKAQELGARDWLIKTDFDPQELVEKIKKQIG